VEGEVVQGEADGSSWGEDYWLGISKGYGIGYKAGCENTTLAQATPPRNGVSPWVAAAFYTLGLVAGIGLTLWYWQSWITAHPLLTM